jgi:probable selenate reductase FAD-binding subunit
MSFPQELTKSIKIFRYFSPRTLKEAISILEELHGNAKILAGGTDLLPMMKLHRVTPQNVISLRNVVGLGHIRETNLTLKIGALRTISEMQQSDLVRERYTSLYEATKTFGTPQIRNMASIGGNICRSSPSADMVPPLITLDSRVNLVGPNGEREVLLEEFFTGPGENALNGEILKEIIVPSPPARCGMAFRKVMRASADLAKVNCAVKIVSRDRICDDVRIAIGGVADTPIRARRTEEIIRGREVNKDVINEAALAVTKEIAPITDVRSTAQYRAHITSVLVSNLTALAFHRSTQV